MYDLINAHDDIIRITTLAEYRNVMLRVMRVIKEAHNLEKKRRLTSRNKKSDEMAVRKQKAKALIASIRRGIPKEEFKRRLEEIFGKGSSKEIETATTVDKCIERIEDISKREEQFEEWEKMRREKRRRQWEDRRLNLFRRKNKTFPTQFGGDEETPKEETLGFWRRINNKEVSEGWRDDESI